MKKRIPVLLLAGFLVLAIGGSCAAPTSVSELGPDPGSAIPPPADSPIPQVRTILVTSAADSGPGSLRQALEDAEPGDLITFDPSVFPPTAPVTISVTSELPHIHQGNMTIDASDVGVILDGSSISTGAEVPGLSIASQWNVVRGLQIINFSGIGIQFHSGSAHNIVEGNLISGNRGIGIGMFNASDNTIEGNYIGTDPSGSQAWGNQYEGIYVNESSNNDILQNLICDNGASGITLLGSSTYSNTVSRNLIGVGANQSSLIGNQDSGVEIRDGAHNNQVGPDNIIANINSTSTAVRINGSDSIENTITHNSIHDSRWIGIDLWGGGNLELAPPIIIDFDLGAGSIRGLAYPNAWVEVFSIEDSNLDDFNRSVFEAQIETDNDGFFILENGEPFAGPHLTVSATDSNGNTSEFSLTTDGNEGTTSLQDGNPLDPTHLETLMSDELEDNHIGSYWHDLWDCDPLTQLLDETRYLGVKRFRFAIAGKDIADGIVADHDDFVSSLEENGMQLNYQLTLYNTLYDDIAPWQANGVEPLCLRFDTNRSDYQQELEYYLEYVEFIVRYFKGRIKYYEIWNEPDNPACYLGISADDYITLVKETVSVIRDLQHRYPEELQDIRIKLGGVANLRSTEAQTYLFYLLESDIMPLVDVISWHPFYGDSPDVYPEYYYAYPEIVQDIKKTASSHGFTGEYHADEMSWRPHSEPEDDTTHPSQGEIAYAKYWARGILMNLGLDVTAGNLRIEHQWVVASSMVRNLSTTMAGNRPISLDVEIASPSGNIASYGFTLPNGDVLLAVWTNDVAVDHDPGINTTLTFRDLSADRVVGIDVLYGFEQELEFTEMANGDLSIPDLMVKDYPIIIKFIDTTP
jgi:parallel beta-helix repeat protein